MYGTCGDKQICIQSIHLCPIINFPKNVLTETKNILEEPCINQAKCFFPHKLRPKTKVKVKMLTLPKILQVAYHMKDPFKGFNWYKNELSVLIMTKVISIFVNQSAGKIKENSKFSNVLT